MTRAPIVRQVPHSPDAEESVLGSVLLDQRMFAEVQAVIGEADFYQDRHQLIWRSMCELDNLRVPFDAMTLSDQFEANGISQLVGGKSYILDLANGTPTARNARFYAEIVRRKSLLRTAIRIGDTLVAEAWEADANPEAVIDTSIRELMLAGQSSRSYEMSGAEACDKVFDNLQRIYATGSTLSGITTGIAMLDTKLGGFHNGDFILIAARPSMGKTSLLGNAVDAAASSGSACGLISGEQPAEQIAARLLSAHAKVAASRLRTGEMSQRQYDRFVEARREVSAMPWRIFDKSAPTLKDVVRQARQWKIRHDIKALYVDYAQRIEGEGKDRYAQVSDVARGLKTLARELDIPVIALAQVNRGVEQRADKRPGMSDISDSGELEKEADQVVMIYRDEYYNQNTNDAKIAELIVEKNRHGPTGTIKTGWDENVMQFFDLAFGREREMVADYESRYGSDV